MPEGTRTKGKEHVQAKSGAAMFAISADVPILPVGISGTYKFFTKVNVNIGKPFKLTYEGGKKPSQEELAAISEEMMKKIYALVEE